MLHSRPRTIRLPIRYHKQGRRAKNRFFDNRYASQPSFTRAVPCLQECRMAFVWPVATPTRPATGAKKPSLFPDGQLPSAASASCSTQRSSGNAAHRQARLAASSGPSGDQTSTSVIAASSRHPNPPNLNLTPCKPCWDRFDVILGTRLGATGNTSMGVGAKQSDSLDQQSKDTTHAQHHARQHPLHQMRGIRSIAGALPLWQL